MSCDAVSMDEAARITGLIAEGEYFKALGVDHESPRLDIDVAAARLSRDHPDLAGILSGITQVIIDPVKKDVYRIACELREIIMQALMQRYGGDFFASVNDPRTLIWKECERLLRCDFEKGAVKIGPRGAASIANRGIEWIIETVINTCLPVIDCNADEDRMRQAVRGIRANQCTVCENTRRIPCARCEESAALKSDAVESWIPILADKLDAFNFGSPVNECPDCNGTGTVPCDCSDLYMFQIPHDTGPGDLITGRGERTGRIRYAIYKRAVVSPRPVYSLNLFYRMHQVGWSADQTLEEAESGVRSGFVFIMPIAWIALGAMIGKFLGSWMVGAVTGIAGILAFIVRWRTKILWKNWVIWIWIILLMLAFPALGAFMGRLLSTWRNGAVTGGILSLVFLLFLLISIRMERMLR